MSRAQRADERGQSLRMSGFASHRRTGLTSETPSGETYDTPARQNCAKSLILSFYGLLHGSKWLQDNQVSSLKPTTSIKLLTQAMPYVRMVSSQKKLTGMYHRAVFTTEKTSGVTMTRCKYPTPLFDGVSWPCSRLRRVGVFTTRRVLGP